MIGNNCTLDLLQLGLRLASTIEVATIFAKYPHWNHAPCRLHLPTLSKEGFEVHQDVDHISPLCWRGDICVSRVVLQTCWQMGQDSIKKEFTELIYVLNSVCISSQNIFSPLGKDLISTPRDLEDVDDTLDVKQQEDTLQGGSLGTELEDAITDKLGGQESQEEPNGTPMARFEPFFVLDGMKVSKAKFLKQSFEQYKRTGSADRLCCVADGDRFINAFTRTNSVFDIISDNPMTNKSLATVDSPIASLVKYSNQPFLAIGEINNIYVNKESVDVVPIDYLGEKSVQVLYQMLNLIPTTPEDDPELRHNWHWSFECLATFTKVPGILIHCGKKR